MKIRKARMILIAAAAIVSLTSLAPAAGAEELSVGAGLGVVPDYEGSQDFAPTVVPFVNAVCSNNLSLNLLYLEALRAAQEAAQQQQRAQGIDFHPARQRNVWSVTSFARVFARFLGRQGGVSGLNAQELEILAAVHARHDRVTENLVRQAFAQAASPTIPEVLFQLQILLHERNA